MIVRFGSAAVLVTDSSLTAASEVKAATRRQDFGSARLNVCFQQERPLKSQENDENEGRLTAKSRHISAHLFANFGTDSSTSVPRSGQRFPYEKPHTCSDKDKGCQRLLDV